MNRRNFVGLTRTPFQMPRRHHLFIVLAAVLLPGMAHAQSTLRAMPSTRATTAVTLAPAPAQPGQPAADTQTVTIRIEYGQPHLRGRALHTDSLVPYGKVWRTGANAATTLTTGVDLLIGGRLVPAGSYLLTTLPARTGWTLIVRRAPAADAAQGTQPVEVARVDLRTQALASPVESLTIWLVPSGAPGHARGELRLAWGNEMHSTDWSVR